MADCETCKHAKWDYYSYYNSREKDWFVDYCKISEDPEAEECESYERVEVDYD